MKLTKEQEEVLFDLLLGLEDEIEEDYEEDNGDKEYEAWYYNKKERELENE